MQGCQLKLKSTLAKGDLRNYLHFWKLRNSTPPSSALALTSLSFHLSLNREGRWCSTDDFATIFLHFPLFSTALWDLANSRPVHSLMFSSHLFLCLPCLLPPFTVLCKKVLARPDERETWPYHCSLRLFMLTLASENRKILSSNVRRSVAERKR